MERFHELLLGELVGGAFDHDDVVLGADIDEVEVAPAHFLVGRVGDELAIDATDAHGGDGTRERDVADHERGARAIDEEHVGIIHAVRTEEDADDLGVVEVALRKERAQRTVGHAAGEDFLFGRPAFALEITAGELAHSGGFFAVIDGQGEPVLALLDGGANCNLISNRRARYLSFEPTREEGNIKFGNELATDEAIVDVAKEAMVHDNIVAFKNQYETILGERGITLSGGQKQRVSIARALLKSPKILLLDDCLSAVDTETEEQILNNLSRITKDKTTIIVSHRVSSIKNANYIIVLDQGQIIEEGTHTQLINIGGYYADLYLKQLSEKDLN